jgi:hypothetical protein
MMDGGAADESLADIRTALAAARARHEALSAEVDQLHEAPVPDQIRLARLKKQKLALKDHIARLDSLLTPDLIA